MNKTIKTIAAALSLSAAAITPAAQAATTATPTLVWPLPVNSSAGVSIQIEAPDKAWGIRPFVRWMDERLSGLSVRTTGTCAENPYAYCVKVIKTSELANETSRGEAIPFRFYEETDGSPENPMLIRLNTSRAPELNKWERMFVAGHEFGHILGMEHHNLGWECMMSEDTMQPIRPCAAEMSVFKETYQ